MSGKLSARTAILTAAQKMGLVRGLREGYRRARRLGMPQLRLEVLDEIPHDPDAFTQGLCWHRGRLYETTGRIGHSSLRELDPHTGAVLRQQPLPGCWAEGLAVIGDSVFVLTYKAGVVMRFALDDFSRHEEIARYEGEGWGLASDGKQLFMSNGSDRVQVRDTRFEVVREFAVRAGSFALRSINDLTVTEEHLYCNIDFESFIYRISLETGRADRVVDCSSLVKRTAPSRHANLNGITRVADTDTFFITGKLWPRMYRVRFRDRA